MITKTINPIHFEDLDPHRFEDLVRQLIYDFKDWVLLEATGRFGSDEGFDARGWESYYDYESDEDAETEKKVNKLNLWLIQCKREKGISPAKMKKYLDDILSGKDNIYGIIFVAACDYSKKTRDLFISRIRERGIQEFILLGKAEIEDLLFQPKYDHLLFAYFGISLQIRKRNIKTKIRARISTKNRIEKIFGLLKERINYYDKVLIRNPEDEHYPTSTDSDNYNSNPQWFAYKIADLQPEGILFMVEKYFAYYDKVSKTYDAIYSSNIISSNLHRRDTSQSANISFEIKNKEWDKLPEENRFYLEIARLVKYDNILAIDENGDNYFDGIHLFVEWNSKNGPFESRIYSRFYKTIDEFDIISPDALSRITIFSKKYRNKK